MQVPAMRAFINPLPARLNHISIVWNRIITRKRSRDFQIHFRSDFLSSDIASYITDLSILHGVGTAQSGNYWRKALFDGSARAHPIGSPRYLSLSVLRI